MMTGIAMIAICSACEAISAAIMSSPIASLGNRTRIGDDVAQHFRQSVFLLVFQFTGDTAICDIVDSPAGLRMNELDLVGPGDRLRSIGETQIDGAVAAACLGNAGADP